MQTQNFCIFMQHLRKTRTLCGTSPWPRTPAWDGGSGPLTRRPGNPDFFAAAAVAAVADRPDFDQVVLLPRDQELGRRAVRLQNVGFTLSVVPIQNLDKTGNREEGSRPCPQGRRLLRDIADSSGRNTQSRPFKKL